MDMEKKLTILSAAARYDVSCCSSGSKRKNPKGGVGNAEACGICHTWTADGRCVSLLKVLMSNQCINQCVYCNNRCDHDIERATFSPQELAELTLSFYRRNYIEGLFLSSGIVKSPDETMDRMLKALRYLREEGRFGGYVHVKAIPGVSPQLLEAVGRYADRMSVNIELPTQDSLRLLAPQKSKETVLAPMGYIRDRCLEVKQEARLLRHAPSFVPAGQSTQMIIGATPDSDRVILRLSEALYRKMQLRRVYYSAYIPTMSHPLLPQSRTPLLREHRLYQSDWLLRFYGFSVEELLDEQRPNLDLALDPKAAWALAHPELFPIEINRAPFEMLLRVPGIGVQSARRIVDARRIGPLHADNLRKLGLVYKRARHFLCCQGRYLGFHMDPLTIRPALLDPLPPHALGQQLSFLQSGPPAILPQGEPLLLLPG